MQYTSTLLGLFHAILPQARQEATLFRGLAALFRKLWERRARSTRQSFLPPASIAGVWDISIQKTVPIADIHAAQDRVFYHRCWLLGVVALQGQMTVCAPSSAQCASTVMSKKFQDALTRGLNERLARTVPKKTPGPTQ